MADVVNQMNSWRLTNESFLSSIQCRMLQQSAKLSDQDNKYSALLIEQNDLKVKLADTKKELDSIRKEAETMKLAHEKQFSELERKHRRQLTEIYSANVETAIQSTLSSEFVDVMYEFYKQKAARLEEANKNVQIVQTLTAESNKSTVVNQSDRAHELSTPEVLDTTQSLCDELTTSCNDKASQPCPVGESEKQRSVTVGGLSDVIKLNGLKCYFSKFGTVEKIILAKSNKNKQKALVVFTDTVALEAITTEQNNTEDSIGAIKWETKYIDEFVNGKLREMEVVDFSSADVLERSDSRTESIQSVASVSRETEGVCLKAPSKCPLNESERQRSIFVGDLAAETQPNDLMAFFTTFGNVSKVIIGLSYTSQKKKALVVFSKKNTRENILAGLVLPQPIGGHVGLTLDYIDYFGINDLQVNDYTAFENTDQSQPTDENPDNCDPAVVIELCQSERYVHLRVVYGPCGHGACGACSVQLEKCHICMNAITSKNKQFD